MAWLEQTNVVDTLGSRISYLRKWVHEQCLDLQKQKKFKKQFLTCWNSLHNEEKNLKDDDKVSFIRKKALTSKGEKNIEESIITNQILKNEDFLEKLLITRQERTTANVGQVEK